MLPAILLRVSLVVRFAFSCLCLCACVSTVAVLSIFGASSHTVEWGLGEARGGRCQGEEASGSSETRKVTRRGPHVLSGQQRTQACVRKRFTMMSISKTKCARGGGEGSTETAEAVQPARKTDSKREAQVGEGRDAETGRQRA